MSRERINLLDRRVIMVVFVLLAGILVLNWRVFQPLRAKRARRAVSREDEFHLPADLDEMAVFAAGQLTMDLKATGPARSAANRIDESAIRDPFHAGPIRDRVISRQPAEMQSGLSCSAVFLGGIEPSALINGTAYQIGDHVRGYRVVVIEAKGVELRKDGERIFLTVIQHGSDKRFYPVFLK